MQIRNHFSGLWMGDEYTHVFMGSVWALIRAHIKSSAVNLVEASIIKKAW